MVDPVSANPLTGNENTCIGYAAGQAIEGTTANNTFVGSQAGTGSTTGYENVALGYKALSGNVQGRHNVAIGVQALDVANPDTATSQYNTAVGAYAGLAVGTGGENTLIGGFAGRNVTSSNYNTMLGYSAGYYNTTGEQNTFVGNSAAQGVNLTKLTGNNHVCVGYKSGFLLQGAATLNTYVGASAGAAATTANDNTAVGAFAFDAGTGANNTAVGSGALGNASNSGTDNVAVGKDAAVGLTSGYDSVYIGHNAGLGATSGYSNTCVGEQSAGGATMSGNENTFLGRASGYSVSSGSNLLLLGNNAGRASAPGGNHTDGNNSIVVGNNLSENAYIKIDWTVTSDERDKTDFTALDLGLDFVKSMKPYTFRWDQRSDYGDSTADNYKVTDQTPDGTHKKDQLDVGFKAQDIEALEKAAGYKISDKTNLVASLTKDETQYGLKYSKFIPILVKAIQEQNTLIETLTARVATLEG